MECIKRIATEYVIGRRSLNAVQIIKFQSRGPSLQNSREHQTKTVMSERENFRSIKNWNEPRVGRVVIRIMTLQFAIIDNWRNFYSYSFGIIKCVCWLLLTCTWSSVISHRLPHSRTAVASYVPNSRWSLCWNSPRWSDTAVSGPRRLVYLSRCHRHLLSLQLLTLQVELKKKWYKWVTVVKA